MENIKIIKLENGDDIVCSFPEEQLPESHALLRIIKPLQIKYIPQLTPGGFKDYVAMVKWAAYTSDKVITIPKTKIMTITNATSEMSKSYMIISKDYDRIDRAPETKTKDVKFKRERLSDQQNEEINEIFDDFADEDPTIH
mgnify:FL=1|tara:strand:+ start:13 stop:435 length:423 start_codon:yes stop_codon:yes gene_type:complete